MSGELHPSWHHQLKAKAFIHHLWDTGHPGALAAVCLGGGKSKITIDLINDLIEECGLSLVLIVAPLRIVDVWEFQLQQHANFPYVFCGLDDRVESVAAKTRAARDAIALARASKQVCIIVVNYEASWREPFASWALNTAWPLVVAEECVPPESQIATPRGNTPIGELKVGDTIFGFDHATGRIIPTAITTVFHHETLSPLISIGDAQLTPEHPVWSKSAGYLPAKLIQKEDEVLIYDNSETMDVSQGLRVLPTSILGIQENSTFLQQKMRLRTANTATTDVGNDEGSTQSARRDNQASRFLDETKSLPTTGNQSKSQGETGHHRLSDAMGRLEGANPTTKIIDCGTWARLANGGFNPQARTIKSIHGRYSQYPAENCDRGGWQQSLKTGSERTGSKKDGIFGITRLAGLAFSEPGNPEGPKPNRSPHLVCNLETGTGNYFVNGLLVHNCHRIKSASGRASRFMGRLSMRAARRLGLSGTPLPHSPLDLWAQYRFLDPSIFDSTYSSFKARYAEWGGFQNRQVKKWRDMEDFNAKFYSIAFRVTKEEALDLPPEMDQTLRCELTREGRAVYDRLENDFVAWLGETPEEQITVQNALVLLLRLQQLTGGTLRDDSGEEHVVDTAKESALAEWLEDLDPKEPAVIFANFTADLDAIRRASERTGHTSAEVSGRSPDGIATWKAGRANILAAQIRIASEGQDFTRAAYCCYYSLGFSLLHYIQSRARIHRPGQTRPVTYYHLLATNTIDEIVLRAVQNRWELVESVLKELKKHVPRLVR